VSIFMVIRLPVPHLEPSPPLTVRNLPGACMAMLLLSCLFLPGTLAVWRPPASGHPMSWRSRLRRGIFLALKIALVQPMMLCGFFLQIVMGPLGGFAGLGFNVASILVLRWVITDKQQRCPVCLRLLTAPVRIGAASRTFLEWYGAESTCSRGHGLLHISETASSFSRRPQWLSLDDSWSGLFPGQPSRGGKRGA